MKKLYDLPIRKKFAVVIVPLIVIIICFDYLQIKYNYLDYSDADRLNSAIVLGVEINHAVHELQKERSISIGFLANQGFEFQQALQKQRTVTDSTINQFYAEIGQLDFAGLLSIHKNEIELLKRDFEGLKSLRDNIDRLGITPEKSLQYFSKINEIALNAVNGLINETRDKDIAQQVHALIYFLKAKERASLERAIGTQAFSEDQIADELFSTFSALIAEQRSYTDAFLVIADGKSTDFYKRTVSGHDVEEVSRLRALILARNDFKSDPTYWYAMTTSKIDMMKNVEDHISEELLIRTETLAASAFKNFWVFLILDVFIGVVAFYLMSTIVTNLLANVSVLEAFTKRISKGDLSKKVKIDTKDEIGQYAKTFNVMLNEINISHDILRKERDKAKFLYNNIYRVSLMVFQNILQGIFLLDRSFKMSKLHSKSMESIFGIQKIAGQNFVNFMRPLIIPRELEALEMFMRHLFNEDMDEDVVNQLNPIEQVKIYSESEGAVSTKFIRVMFTRIWKGDHIKNIMVTVSDETESILLQQHLEDAEKKKKQETEQVLSILKIDPSLIRGFLYNAKRTLKGVSEKYESHKKKNLAELLDFTFQTIHNLKGNAVVIGLDLMSNKFHEIEDSLDKLKGKQVTGKDFLTVLYEIDEADRMIDDMSTMLRKVADIYRKYPSGGHIVSNIMLIDTLEKAVKVMSNKIEKPVDFFFKNEANFVIPDHYINNFRDIMIQLIRNSISHGIEDRGVRMNAGKMIGASITVDLDQPKDEETLRVTYTDDGRGLDIDKIIKNAVTRNFITEFEAKNISAEKAVDLIYESGFSTSDEVDEYSGRGQGMSLVASLIQDMNGTFNINFEEDKYFKMVIDLPIVPRATKEDKSDETTNS